MKHILIALVTLISLGAQAQLPVETFDQLKTQYIAEQAAKDLAQQKLLALTDEYAQIQALLVQLQQQGELYKTEIAQLKADLAAAQKEIEDLLTQIATPVNAVEVYPGCEVPTETYARTVDIAPGTFDIKKVLPGDRLVFQAGVHPSFTVSKWNAGHLVGSKAWIKVEGAPGAIFKGINITDMSRWFIQGVKIESKTGNLTSFGSSQQVVLADSVLTGGDSTNWTAQDWVNAASAMGSRNGKCLTWLRNDVSSVRWGIAVSGDALAPADNAANALIKDNKIDRVSGDHIRFLASNTIFKGNRLTNMLVGGTDDGNHDDFAQGFALPWCVIPLDPARPCKIIDNVTFESNWIQDTVGAPHKFHHSGQGISSFDGLYRNLKVINNTVLTCHYHGISMYGVQNTLIEGNKVISTCPATNTQVANKLWISAPPAKVRKNADGSVIPGSNYPSSNVTIRNNYMSALGGVSPGNTVTNNTIVKDPKAVFKVFDIPNGIYDLTLK